MQNVFNLQNYYPNWISENEITFTGTCLPGNAVDESGKGTYYVLYCFPWGYADNHPNGTTMSQFNIDWAVDADGYNVFLSRIDFVKVYTGINQQAGRLGETSTEVSGACDLHPTATTDLEDGIETIHNSKTISGQGSTIVNLSGQTVNDRWQKGIYISNGKKFIIQ